MRVLLFLLLTAMPLELARGQSSGENSVLPLELKRLVVAAESNSDSVIAVPPIKSVVVAKRGEKVDPSTNLADLAGWFKREAAANGLPSRELNPWHIVVEYDQYDEDGDNVHSGVFEEYWAGPKKYKRIYKSDTSIRPILQPTGVSTGSETNSGPIALTCRFAKKLWLRSLMEPL